VGIEFNFLFYYLSTSLNTINLSEFGSQINHAWLDFEAWVVLFNLGLLSRK
jgi:hypothetical protein